MKKAVLIAVLATAMVIPAFSQVRLDVGVEIPITVGVISSSGVETAGDVGEFLSHPLPFPYANFGYQINAGPLKIVPGIRVFTIVLESILWPNVLVELELGRLSIDAQVGGLAFVVFGLFTDADFGAVVVPDVSVWYGLGKKGQFRLGGGVIGLYVPELTEDAMAIVPYLGGKVALTF